MKKLSVLCVVSGAAMLLLAGCAFSEYSIDPVENGPTVEGGQVVATGKACNNGFYLFNRWALSAGNPGRPNTHDYRTFCDDVRPDRNADMLLRGMRKLYKADKLINVTSEERAWGWFSLWLVWRRTIVTEADGVKLNGKR